MQSNDKPWYMRLGPQEPSDNESIDPLGRQQIWNNHPEGLWLRVWCKRNDRFFFMESFGSLQALHRVGQPAELEWEFVDERMILRKATWYQSGLRHRDDGAAVQCFFNKKNPSKPSTQLWYINGSAVLGAMAQKSTKELAILMQQREQEIDKAAPESVKELPLCTPMRL